MKKLATELKQFKDASILLLGHKNADPDSVCSVVALSLGLEQLGYKTRRGVIESVSKLSQKILDSVNEKVEVDPNLENVDLIIMLDMSTEGQLSTFAEKLFASKAKKMIIDHHTVHEYSLKADYSFIDEQASSTVELVYDLLNELKSEIDEKIAKLILLGTVAETAHLQYAGLKNFEILTELMKKFNIEYELVLATLETQLDVSERIARLKAAQRVKYERIGDFLLATSKIKSFEASAARALIRAGADLVAVAAEKENELRISVRSTPNFFEKTKIDLGRDVMPGVAKIIQGTGSGHPTAAGANGKQVKKADEALKYIVEYTKNTLNQPSQHL